MVTVLHAAKSVMLHIKKVEVEGFKTFGKKMIINLGPGYTAITGPNGSGKSNIFDAILFALGESSLKTLRATSIKGLLFDGGINGTRASKAVVSIQFDNSEREIPVESNSVIFTRELRNDGDSIFKINGKHVTRQAVLNLAQLCLISPEAFNVILQGMINRVAELRPDERRRLLEMLVGVAQFDEKKNEALQNLADASHKLEIAFARIDEIRNVLRKNEEGRNNLIRYHHLEEEIRHLNAMKTSKAISILTQAINSSSTNLEEERSILKKKLHDRERLSSEIESVKNERSGFLGLVSDPSKAFVNYEMELASIQSHILSLNSTVKILEQRNYEIEQDSLTLNGMLNKLEADVNVSTESLNRIEESKEHLESERAQLLQRIKALNLQVSGTSKSISSLKMEKIKADQRIKRIDLLLERINAHKSKVVATQIKLNYRFSVFENKQKSFSVILNELRQSLANLDTLLQTESVQIVSVSKSYEDVENLRKTLTTAIETSLGTLENVQLTTRKAEMARKVAEKVLDIEGLERLIALARTGAIEGCIGFVKDIISYDEKYSKAVYSACGFWMNAIVVKDLESANKLIELAEKIQVKQFNMIILVEIKQKSSKGLPVDTDVEGYLGNFVNTADEYKELKTFLFFNTVLVKDVTVASRVSREGYRCATVDGAMYEPYGSGYFSSFPNVFEDSVLSFGKGRYYEELEDAISSLKKIVERRRKDMEFLDAKGKGLLEKKASFSMELGQVHGEIDALIKFVKKYSETYDENLKKLDSLRVKVVKIEEYLKRLQEKSNRLAGKRELLMKILQSNEENEQAQMLLTLNGEMTDLTNQHQSIINQLNEVNLQLAQTKNRLENSLLASRDNTKKSLDKLKAESDTNKKRIEESRLMFTESQLKYDSLKSKEEEFRQASANMQKTLSEYDMRINEKTAQFNSLNELISKSTLRMNQVTSRIDNLREKSQTEYNTLRMYGDGTLVEYEEGCEAGLTLLDQEASELRSVLNYLAEKDYQNVFESYKNLSLRSNQLEEEKNSIIEMIDQIDNRKRDVFMESFEKIDRNLRMVFAELTKGDAWLEIEKPDDIFSGGVYLMVQFPEKKPKESLMLSGGEKTITTVAFVLAMQSAFKSPFYLFDEIDAHLDALNLERLIAILRKRATESQIILITLKDVTLTKADKILGVYQRQGSASLVEYSPEMKVEEVQS